MSAGYGPPAVNTFGMIAGLGQAFGDSYDAARKRSQEDDAPELFGKLMGLQSAPASAPAITMGTLGQTAPSTPAAPTFTASGGAIGDYLKTTRAVESGGNDLAANPNSSAKGRYQFTDSTWQSVAKAHPELGLQPGGWRDPAQQEKAMAAFTSDNAGILSGKGIPINPGNLYVAHFLGAGGATKFIPGAINNPDAPAVAFVSPGAARANRSIFFNRDGSPKTAGEVYAERTGRFVSREPVATPALSAGGAVPGVPSMMSAGAPATMPAAPARPTGARVPAFLGSRADGGFDPNAIQAAPTAVASAQASPEADMPVAGAQPAQFQIPGQPAPAAAPTAAPVAQGFSGMGGGTSRISPEQAEILKQAWRNPNTRAMATSVYQSILQGKDSPWKMDNVDGVSSWVNGQTRQVIPVNGGQRFRTETDAAGNQFQVSNLTGERSVLMKAEKDDKFTYQSMPGIGMVALHPSDPDRSRVIIAGQQPRPFTAEERQAWNVPQDSSVGMGADGKPFTIGGAKTEVKIDTKGAGKFAEKANEIQAKRYGEMVDAADRAVPLRADIDTLANLGAQIGTGKFTEARAGLAQYAKAAGLDSVADGLVGGKLGEIEAYSSLVDKLTPQMRVPGSGATSDREGASFKNSLPSLLKTPEGNAVIADTFRGLADYQAQVGDLAGKALRGEISQSEADQAIKTLPSPYQRLKEYQAAAKGKDAGGELKPVPGGRPPQGYTGGSYVDRAKKTLATRPDLKPQLQKMLSDAGIDPKRLDQ